MRRLWVMVLLLAALAPSDRIQGALHSVLPADLRRAGGAADEDRGSRLLRFWSAAARLRRGAQVRRPLAPVPGR